MAFNKINKGQPDWHIPLNQNFLGIEDGSLLPEDVAKYNDLGGISLLNGENVWDNSLNFGKNENLGNIKPTVPSVGGLDNGTLLLLASKSDDWTQLFLNTQGNFSIHQGKGNTTEKSGEIWTGLNFPIESGTWTPGIKGTINPGNHIYALRTGWYYRIGKQVTIGFEVVVNKTDWDNSASGDLAIGPLPFLPKFISGCVFSVVNGVNVGVVNNGYQLMGSMLAGHDNILLTTLITNHFSSPLSVSAIQNNSGNVAFFGGATYIIN